MRKVYVVVPVAFLALLGACASVPQESVELSATVGRDLVEAHRANRELAVRYFARMRRDVEAFVTDVYRPYVIRHTMDALNVVADIQAATKPGSDLDPVDVMEAYVTEALFQVGEFRRGLLEPIVAQEAQVLEAIDQTYQRLTYANSVVTAHLASVRKVHDVESELLRSVGAGDMRDVLANRVAAFSVSVDGLLRDARKADSLLDQGPSKLADVRKLMDDLSAKFRALDKGRERK